MDWLNWMTNRLEPWRVVRMNPHGVTAIPELWSAVLILWFLLGSFHSFEPAGFNPFSQILFQLKNFLILSFYTLTIRKLLLVKAREAFFFFTQGGNVFICSFKRLRPLSLKEKRRSHVKLLRKADIHFEETEK